MFAASLRAKESALERLSSTEQELKALAQSARVELMLEEEAEADTSKMAAAADTLLADAEAAAAAARQRLTGKLAVERRTTVAAETAADAAETAAEMADDWLALLG